ncbi:MAG: sigma-54-dependent Fis family transcriptional regulator [Candidatus Omnitrophica bacterium]|nr:sigma-54-dependent Fis family transcriptional regulator [Candidatus Omnitrophota bacterium]
MDAPANQATLLIVDDEEEIHYSLKRYITSHLPCTILKATSGEEALSMLQIEIPDLIIMDIKMGGMDGLTTLKEINKRSLKVPVIIMTAYSTTASAIEATRLGAYDYVLKPFDPPSMMSIIQNALSMRRLMQKSVVWGVEEDQWGTDDVLIGSSAAMQDVYKFIGRVADSSALVLITGESGTGKELVARAIYGHSPRSKNIFLPVNCAAIPENLLESELFGHEKGAFTGAHERRIGKFEQADKGTIFLDEIGEMSMLTQGKLLRVLQDKSFQRVGGKDFIYTDARIIAATNRNLAERVKNTQFREDLYYRLQVMTIHLPPLRERRSDIPLLARYFAWREGHRSLSLSKEAEEFLLHYNWPGNIRELENAIQRAFILSRGNIITVDHLKTSAPPPSLPREQAEPAAEAPRVEGIEQALDQLWRQIIEQQQDKPLKLYQWLEIELARRAMEHTGGNQVQAAKLLGISRNTLRQRLGL